MRELGSISFEGVANIIHIDSEKYVVVLQNPRVYFDCIFMTHSSTLVSGQENEFDCCELQFGVAVASASVK